MTKKQSATEAAIKVLEEQNQKKLKKHQEAFNKVIQELEADGFALDVSFVITSRGNIPQINIVQTK